MRIISANREVAHYRLGTPLGWQALEVVRWHGVDRLSAAYDYEVVASRPRGLGPVALEDLLDRAACLAIEKGGMVRVVHGIVSEAEEIERTPELFLYALRIVPAWARAKLRSRSRTFVGKTLRAIVSSVLENRWHKFPGGQHGLLPEGGSVDRRSSATSEWVDPVFTYAWCVQDSARVDDASLYPFVAQYDESDFDFVARLLEREGISFVFDHTESGTVLSLTDAPVADRAGALSVALPLRTVSHGLGESNVDVVVSLRSARRLRATRAIAREYDWRRSRTLLESVVESRDAAADLAQYAFGDGDGLEKDRPGQLAARVRVERDALERELQHGVSTSHAVVAGARLSLRDDDGLRGDQDLLIVSSEAFGVQRRPDAPSLHDEAFGFDGRPLDGFAMRFEAIPAAMPFRPALATRRPKVHGIQTAVVTAEVFHLASRTEIYTDDFGRVRVRFTWDQRPDLDDGTPSSEWVRVSQIWAGAGWGGLFTPRVEQEVLVAFLGGDPDKPIVVGRVYNPQLPPPYDPSKQPTVSTVKSQSSPDKADGFNELRFDDLADKEEIFLHAERNLTEIVKETHAISVGGSQSNSVGGDQSNSVGGNRTHSVKGNERCTVEGARTHVVNAGEAVTVSSGRHVTIHGEHTHFTTANYSSVAAASHNFLSTTTRFIDTASFTVDAAGAQLFMSKGVIRVDNGAGASISLVGNAIFLNAATIVSTADNIVSDASSTHLVEGADTKVKGSNDARVQGGTVKVKGDGVVSVKSGGTTNVNAGGDVNVSGSLIKLNG